MACSVKERCAGELLTVTPWPHGRRRPRGEPMDMTRSVRTRISVLLGAATLILAGIVPLLTTAQDATPSGDQAASLITQGEQIYHNVCTACHQPGGEGITGIYPPLNNNPLLTAEDPTYFISTVLTGRGGMPSFAGLYSDEEIAAVITFVRQEWDNDASPVSPEQVAAVRATLSGTPVATPLGEATPSGQRPGGDATASPEATP